MLRLKYTSLAQLKDDENTIPVVVSLTTIPSRLTKVHITIRSILSQTAKPKKVVLWVHESLRNQIPESLERLKGNIFEIAFTPLDCSHMKLILSLQKYPDDIIITSDDDLIYDTTWLEKLYGEHLKHQDCIIANQTRVITHGDDNTILPYKQWPTNYDPDIKTDRILPIGSAGALYPPNSLFEKVTDMALIEQLAPKADDLWFKAMSLLQGTTSLQAENQPKHPIPIMGSQTISLKKQNIGKDLNRKQWQNLTAHFNLSFKE